MRTRHASAPAAAAVAAVLLLLIATFGPAGSSPSGQTSKQPPETRQLPAAETPAELARDELARWMTRALDGRNDPDATMTLAAEAAATLEQAPGVVLDQLRCNDRFCRASLTGAGGVAPDVAPLIGHPPFSGEGFAIAESGGTVAMYFTRAGESLHVLRDEARAALAD